MMLRNKVLLVERVDSYFLIKRNSSFWETIQSMFKSRPSSQNANYRKRIGGFQPVKTEILAKRTYYWCTCGYSQSQALCDEHCRDLSKAFRPLKFTSEKHQFVDLCMCKDSKTAPYCDHSCDQRFAGLQMKTGNGVAGTYDNFKSFLSTVPKGVEEYRKFTDQRQKQLETIERLRKKFDDEKDKKK